MNYDKNLIMDIEGSVIETGVDKLVKIVKERGRIALTDAAAELGVSQTVIQEWMNFLEDEGIISVEYKLTKPYLVERKLTKKEVESKAKEFASKKDVFVRKAEVSLNFIKKQGEELKNVKSEFDRMKNDMGMQLETVRGELGELEKYHQLKQEMQKQIEEQKNDTKLRLGELIRQIETEQKRYGELIEGVKKGREELIREKSEAASIEESEKILNKRLGEMKNMIILIEKKMSYEDSAIKNSESHIERLSSLVEDTKSHVEEEKSAIGPLIEKSKEQEKKVFELQSHILKRIAESQRSATNVKEIIGRVNAFFDKKLAVANLVDKVNKDRDELEKELIGLIKKAKAFQLTAKSSDAGRDMADLGKKFEEVDKKKGVFEEELKKLSSFFK